MFVGHYGKLLCRTEISHSVFISKIHKFVAVYPEALDIRHRPQ